MTICIPSLKTKCIPLCLTDLIIGAIGIKNKAVHVYIKDLTTGRTEMFPSLSEADGYVVIDISAATFSDNHTYELWITLATANINDKQNITVDASTDTTLSLCFEDVEFAGAMYHYSNQSLEVA